jgi:glycosyltransferase involved in cell wall biosynthesis
MGQLQNLDRRLRVAHVTLGLDMGGLEKMLVEFARHADREHFDLRFISLTTRGELCDEIEKSGWPVIAFGAPLGFRPRLILRLASLFRRWQIDVVHTHDDRPLIHAAPAARLAHAQCVIHTRHGQSPKLTRRQTALVNLAARFTDQFVCVSRDSARRTIEHGVAASRVRTIWNGIDLDRFTCAGPSPGGPIVTVARLSPEKGVAELVRATALAVRKIPTLRVDIAGDGPCLIDLKRLTQELHVAENVRFLGQVNDIPSLLARASLFVLPSLSEGVSLTVLEAMARGLPVVATRVGGNVEVVVEGRTGLLIPAQDAAALASAMRRLWLDTATASQMGLAGRQRVVEQFDIRRVVASYEALYPRSEALPAMRNVSLTQRVAASLPLSANGRV